MNRAQLVRLLDALPRVDVMTLNGLESAVDGQALLGPIRLPDAHRVPGYTTLIAVVGGELALENATGWRIWVREFSAALDGVSVTLRRYHVLAVNDGEEHPPVLVSEPPRP